MSKGLLACSAPHGLGAVSLRHSHPLGVDWMLDSMLLCVHLSGACLDAEFLTSVCLSGVYNDAFLFTCVCVSEVYLDAELLTCVGFSGACLDADGYIVYAWLGPAVMLSCLSMYA
eukprot:jgi/Botrbrau1/15371/Bobra.43_2s0002.1